MRSSLKIARIAGIDIGIHYTWVFAYALIAWSLAVGFFPSTFRGFDATTYWVLGIIGALLLFVSVLVHELSHSFVALARGMQVHGARAVCSAGQSISRARPKKPRTSSWSRLWARSAVSLWPFCSGHYERPLGTTPSPIGAVCGSWHSSTSC